MKRQDWEKAYSPAWKDILGWCQLKFCFSLAGTDNLTTTLYVHGRCHLGKCWPLVYNDGSCWWLLMMLLLCWTCTYTWSARLIWKAGDVEKCWLFFIVDDDVNLCWWLFMIIIARSARSVCKAGYCLNEGTCTVAIIAPGIPNIALIDWMFGVIIFTIIRRAPACLFLFRRIQRGSLPAQTRADIHSKQDNYIIIFLQNWSISLPGYIVVTIVCLSFAAVIVISTWWITTR